MNSPHDRIDADQLLAQLGWVRALAQRLVADPNVADDVLQRVCLRALEHPPGDVGEAGLRRWLATLTRRLAGHTRRADGRRRRRERTAAVPEAQPSTVDLAARREVLRSVVDAVTALEERDFSVIIQRYFDGRGVADIAASDGASADAVRQRLSRARARLRRRLEHDLRHDLGPDRQRWLAALGPLALPLAVSRDIGHTALWQQTGALLMAKTLPNLAATFGAKIVLALALVSIVAFTTWHVADEPETPLAATETVLPGTAPPSDPVDMPELPAATRDEPTVELALAPVPVAETPPVVAESPQASVDLTLPLDAAMTSFSTSSPDLMALNALLRRLAQSARVLPDSVATNPLDSSVHGWLEFTGSELKAEFKIDGDDYSLTWTGAEVAELTPEFTALELGIQFTNDAGRADAIGTRVEFHAAQDIELQPDERRTVGWNLQLGHRGTTGRPIIMQRIQDGLMVSVTGGDPELDQTWANDTSPYDMWLAKLGSYAP